MFSITLVQASERRNSTGRPQNIFGPLVRRDRLLGKTIEFLLGFLARCGMDGFVKQVERPHDQEAAIMKRTQIANLL